MPRTRSQRPSATQSTIAIAASWSPSGMARQACRARVNSGDFWPLAPGKSVWRPDIELSTMIPRTGGSLEGAGEPAEIEPVLVKVLEASLSSLKQNCAGYSGVLRVLDRL